MAKKTTQRQLEHHELTDWVEQAPTAEEQAERAEHANAGYPVMVTEEAETPKPTTRKTTRKASRPNKVIVLVTPESPIVTKAKKEPEPPQKPSSQAATVTEFMELKNRDFYKYTKINMEKTRGVEN